MERSSKTFQCRRRRRATEGVHTRRKRAISCVRSLTSAELPRVGTDMRCASGMDSEGEAVEDATALSRPWPMEPLKMDSHGTANKKCEGQRTSYSLRTSHFELRTGHAAGFAFVSVARAGSHPIGTQRP